MAASTEISTKTRKMSRLVNLLCLLAFTIHSTCAAPVAREWDWKYWLNACPTAANDRFTIPMKRTVHRRSLIVAPNAAATEAQEKTKDLLGAVGEYAGSVQRMAQVLKAERVLSFGGAYSEDQLKNFEWETLPAMPDAGPAEFIQLAAASDPTARNDLSKNIATVVQYTYHMLQSLAAHLSQSQKDQQTRRDLSIVQLGMFERLNFGQDGLRALLCALRMVMDGMGTGPDAATEEQLKRRDITSLSDRNLLAVRDVLTLKRLQEATEFTKKLADLILQPSMWSSFVSGRRAANRTG